MAHTAMPTEVVEHAVLHGNVISFDCETTGLNAFTCVPTLYTIASGAGSNIKCAAMKPGPLVHDFLAAVFRDPTIKIVMHNSSFDCKIVHRFICPFRQIRAYIADTMVYAWLVDNRGAPKYGKRFSLKSLSQKDLGHKMATLDEIYKKNPLAQRRAELEKKAIQLKKHWMRLAKRHHQRKLAARREFRNYLLRRISEEVAAKTLSRTEASEARQKAREHVSKLEAEFEPVYVPFVQKAVERLLYKYRCEHSAITEKLRQQFILYALDDAVVTLRLYWKYRKQIKEAGLASWCRVEMDSRMMATDMELNGVLIDAQRIAKLEDAFVPEIEQLEREAYRIVGQAAAAKGLPVNTDGTITFSLGSNKEVSFALHHIIGAWPPAFIKMQEAAQSIKDRAKDPNAKPYYSVKKRVLMYTNHPLARVIEQWRGLTKLRSTYTKKLRITRGRLHAFFRSTGTDTGRWSSSGPNLQNIPSRSKLGKQIREAFVARPGYKLIVADFSQIELRVAAIVCNDKVLLDTYSQYKDMPDGGRDYTVGDVHKTTQDKLSQISPVPIDRPLAKICNFALLYGMSEDTFIISFMLDAAIGTAAHKAFFDTYTGISETIEELGGLWKYGDGSHQAGIRRWRIPFSGRVRTWDRYQKEKDEFVRDEHGDIVEVRVSKGNILNTLVQGSAADILKKAVSLFRLRVMTNPRYADIYPLMQVHDELVFEVREDIALEVAALLKYCMEYPHFKTPIPILADVKIVDRWSEGKDGERPVFEGVPYASPVVMEPKIDKKTGQPEMKDGQPVMVPKMEDVHPELNEPLHYLGVSVTEWCRQTIFGENPEPEQLIPFTDYVARN